MASPRRPGLHQDLGLCATLSPTALFQLHLLRAAPFRPSTGDQFEQEEHRDFFGAQIVQGWNHGLAGLDSISEAGLRVRHDDIRASLADTESRVPFRTVSDDRVGETETGLYLQNTTRWTQWLQTLAGVREQFISMKMDALATPRHGNHLPAAGAVALNRGAWPNTRSTMSKRSRQPKVLAATEREPRFIFLEPDSEALSAWRRCWRFLVVPHRFDNNCG